MKTLQFLYMWSRTIHRFLVVFMMIFGLTMATTGMTMKYPTLLTLIDPSTALFFHTNASVFFVPILLGMMVTGLYMYVHPYLIKWVRRVPAVPPTASQAKPTNVTQKPS